MRIIKTATEEPNTIHLFDAFGVELEYMIVDRNTLSIAPLCDQILHSVAGEYISEVEVGKLSWSNELVAHVVELKTNGPVDSLNGLADVFQSHVKKINQILEPLNARLMPTAMHPWMNPKSETHLWPHEYSPVYEAMDRIFSCQGHGWANLQSVHLNLPFADDEEFARLHSAIRLVLPIIPAIAASSPIVEMNANGILDNRLEAYRHNAKRIPTVTSRVIPESIATQEEYEREILQPMYREIAPLDPEGVLQYEWLNARGAIARFDRKTIEIRLIDSQECPSAELVILRVIVNVLHSIVEERWSRLSEHQSWSIDPLESIFLSTVREGESAVISNPAYLRAFGFERSEQCSAGELWRHLVESVSVPNSGITNEENEAIQVILNEGTLARRIMQSLPGGLAAEDVRRVYEELCSCVAGGNMFHAEKVASCHHV